MKLIKAIRVVGYDIELSCNRDPLPGGVIPIRDWWRATGRHPDYGYEILTYSVDEQSAIGQFVDENYRIISKIVLTEQQWRCAGCRRSGIPLEIDHIIPRSQGRLDIRSNLRGLGSAAGGGCGCHRKRHTVRNFVSLSLEELCR
jgi:hypothetical protein